jgi:hypothetical protein
VAAENLICAEYFARSADPAHQPLALDPKLLARPLAQSRWIWRESRAVALFDASHDVRGFQLIFE